MRVVTTSILSIFLIPHFLFAQVDVRGTVADSTSGERIPYANIVVLQAAKGAAANLSGFFLIPKVQPGTYEITASAVGYAKQTRTITVSGTQPIVVNFRLAPIAIQLGEVLVTERAKPELLEIQTSVHVVDKTELRRVPVAAQPDLLRSIQILPGIVSTSDVNAQFYVRGGGGDQNLILLDGMKIYHPFHAFGILGSFDPDIIRTAEVYTGAFPTEFGTRLSSVININTRDGNARSFSGQAEVNILSSKLQLEGPVTENIQTILTARKSLFSGTFRRFLKESVPLSFYDAFWKVTLKNPNGQDSYSGQAFLSGDELLSSKLSEPDYRWTSRAIGVQASLPSENRLFWNLVAAAGEFRQERIVKESGSANPSLNSVRELSLRANVTYYTDSKDLYFFGFELSFPNFDYTLTNRLGVPVHLKSTIVEFGSWARYQARRGLLHADAGLRIEIGSLVQGHPPRTALQPRISLSFDLPYDWKAKAAYGRFSQNAITVSNEDDVIPIFNPWISVPKGLHPEQADHYVLGLEGNVMRSLSFNIQSYYKRYGSLVTYNRDKIDQSDPDYINSKGESYGGEALLRFAHPFVDIYAAYTLTWARIRINDFIYAPRYDRRHTVNLLTSLHPARDFSVTMRWEFGSGLPFTQSIGFYDKLTLGNGYPDPFYLETGTPYTLYGPKNAARLPPYHRLDLGVSYWIRFLSSVRAMLGFNIVNVYDRKNIFYFDRQTGQRIDMLSFFPSANVALEFLP